MRTFAALNPDVLCYRTGYNNVRSDPLIVELAAKYKVAPAQIVLAWHLARGVVVVPKSSNAERQKENVNVSVVERSCKISADQEYL